ncbi:MAG: hypothetical protein K2R98_05945 [Gemmataceae bacterium]|nr:hypothetical protein [Gemmataceae bacterium]
MTPQLRRVWPLALAIGLFPLFSLADEPSADDEQPGVTPMARGPVHEAFAQPSNSKPEPSQVVPNKPPAPIKELPPDQKPKGEDVIWVPGYWAWDMEKKDFLWVSGIWRVPPPNRKWVPGYWHETDQGWQYIAGFWANAKQADLKYTDPPPASMDNGANTPPPDADRSWVPGTWLWRDGEWVWRAGFWNQNYSGWTYQPPNYTWTPNGYLFTDGYWDYGLSDRGLLFAPVCFAQPYWNDPSWCYTPYCAVNCNSLLSCLWYGPGCGSYWFGNCYGSFWRGCGFQPWCVQGPRCHDGLWASARWNNRNNNGWANGQRQDFVGRFNGTSARPATTLAGQNAQARIAGQGGNHGQHPLVTPLNKLGNSAGLTKVSRDQMDRHRGEANHGQQASNQRGRSEGMARSTGQNTVKVPPAVNHLASNMPTKSSGATTGGNPARTPSAGDSMRSANNPGMHTPLSGNSGGAPKSTGSPNPPSGGAPRVAGSSNPPSGGTPRISSATPSGATQTPRIITPSSSATQGPRITSSAPNGSPAPRISNYGPTGSSASVAPRSIAAPAPSMPARAPISGGGAPAMSRAPSMGGPAPSMSRAPSMGGMGGGARMAPSGGGGRGGMSGGGGRGGGGRR